MGINATAEILKLADDCFARRKATLEFLGAPANGQRQRFPTADVVKNPETGVIYVVTDYDPSGDDWSAVCRTLDEWGVTEDIGEPMFGRPARVWFWILG